jgi:hypothetical protein
MGEWEMGGMRDGKRGATASFQSLEKTRLDFPSIGKIADRISKHWKNRERNFQWLETHTHAGKVRV